MDKETTELKTRPLNSWQIHVCLNKFKEVCPHVFICSSTFSFKWLLTQNNHISASFSHFVEAVCVLLILMSTFILKTSRKERICKPKRHQWELSVKTLLNVKSDTHCWCNKCFIQTFPPKTIHFWIKKGICGTEQSAGNRTCPALHSVEFITTDGLPACFSTLHKHVLQVYEAKQSIPNWDLCGMPTLRCYISQLLLLPLSLPPGLTQLILLSSQKVKRELLVSGFMSCSFSLHDEKEKS